MLLASEPALEQLPRTVPPEGRAQRDHLRGRNLAEAL